MVIPTEGKEELAALVQSGKIDLITFASSSTVENFVKMVDKNIWKKVRAVPVASIGPITTETIKKFKLNLKIQPKQYTIPALVQAITYFYQS